MTTIEITAGPFTREYVTDIICIFKAHAPTLTWSEDKRWFTSRFKVMGPDWALGNLKLGLTLQCIKWVEVEGA